MSRTESPASATQPSTKKVARTPCSAKRSRISRVEGATRRGSLSHVWGGKSGRRFSTWNHSSISNVMEERVEAVEADDLVALGEQTLGEV